MNNRLTTVLANARLYDMNIYYSPGKLTVEVTSDADERCLYETVPCSESDHLEKLCGLVEKFVFMIGDNE
jgi:hypothetical protein